MSPLRTLLCTAAILAGLAHAAAAQVPAAKDEPVPMGGSDMGAMEPVMDRTIFAHVLFDQFEGRTSSGTPDFRRSAQGWIGTDYDRFWVKSEGFVRNNGKVEDGRHEFLYDRAISTYRLRAM